MPKTNYVPVVGLDPMGGEKPVGVQHRLKAATGPFIPHTIDPDSGACLLVTCARGDVTLKHIDEMPVQREDLVPGEVLEVADDDRQTFYELLQRARGNREAALSEAAGYDSTTVTPAAQGPAVHTDADGTVLTAQEVAARQGLNIGPTLEEAQAWWSEQTYLHVDYENAVPSELAELVGRIPLNEVEYVDVLESDPSYESSPAVTAAVVARLAAHAEAANAPGWSPLEDGVSIAEARKRIAAQGDPRIVAGWLDAETAGKGRKRLRAALQERLEQIGEAPAVAPLPGEDEPEGAVAEEPFA